MANVSRHAAGSILAYNPNEYHLVRKVQIGQRHGVVIEKNGNSPRQHTVLLGRSYVPDSENGAGALRAPTEPEFVLLSQIDDDASAGVSADALGSNSTVPIQNSFVLNKESTDSVNDAAEISGVVPVACTCDDWKWRGVRHRIARVRTANSRSRRDMMRKCYALNPRRSNDPAPKNISNDDGLAAAASGCRHMEWVRKNVRSRPLRQRRVPSRFRAFVTSFI